LLELAGTPSVVADRDDWHWCRPGTPLAVGVPAPVAVLLREALLPTLPGFECTGEDAYTSNSGV
jgi:hypothetical protein